MKNGLEKSANTNKFAVLPSVDALLQAAKIRAAAQKIGSAKTTQIIREILEEIRENLRSAQDDFSFASKEKIFQNALERFAEKTQMLSSKDLQKVINATGVIIHTNLGRAPLSADAQKAFLETAARCCNLEYDLTNGKRGRRGAFCEELLAELTGAEAALIVNNCAAATFFILAALANGGECVVSRGELVEIGGDFRVPDVMAQAGAKMREVGTTNRTKPQDFANACGEQTKMFVRIHPSNFRVVGFTKMPSLKELAELAREKNVILFEDAGSGALIDLSAYNLDEPVISQSIADGADIVSFSGDKLLGGVQCGIIVGRGELIEKLRKHPLYRALRVDKTIYAALGATLQSYRRDAHFDEIPVLQMISETAKNLCRRSENLVENARHNGTSFDLEIVEGKSAIGGGSAPLTRLPSFLIAVSHSDKTPNDIEKDLRENVPPIIARIEENRLLIDLRTVAAAEEIYLTEFLTKQRR